jgi:hypothetical protein
MQWPRAIQGCVRTDIQMHTFQEALWRFREPVEVLRNGHIIRKMGFSQLFLAQFSYHSSKPNTHSTISTSNFVSES